MVVGAASAGGCGLIVGVVVARLPGHGGHVPVEGLEGWPAEPVHLPGVLLATLASLILGQ